MTASKTKCARTGCKRTTKDPRRAGWAFFSEAPDAAPHWQGQWVCKPCVTKFMALMAAEGIEPEKGRVQ